MPGVRRPQGLPSSPSGAVDQSICQCRTRRGTSAGKTAGSLRPTQCSSGFCTSETTMSIRPVILLDFDDVIVLNRPGEFGGFDVISPDPPPALWSRLFHAPATEILVEALSEHRAQVVITTSWLRFMLRDGLERLFAKTGLEVLNSNLHDAWEAPQNHGETRAQAIDRWLAAHHRGEPYVILDDELSGTGLRRSLHDRRGRVVLCKANVGLHRGHAAAIRSALSRPSE